MKELETFQLFQKNGAYSQVADYAANKNNTLLKNHILKVLFFPLSL